LNIISGDEAMNKKGGDKPTTVNIRESANIPTMTRVPSDFDISINSANIPTMQQAPETTTTSQGSGGGNDSGSSSGGSSSGKE
jgi:hypothetical protein